MTGEIQKTKASIWSSRLAMFAILLTLTALLLHRFGGFPTGLLINTFAASMALAAGAVLLGVTALIVIWRTGRSGTFRAVLGLILAAFLFAWPATVMQMAAALPTLNDVTTDPQDPPQITLGAAERGLGANSTVYPGIEAARAQDQHYPYVKPIIIDRSVQEAFELAQTSAKRLNWTIIGTLQPKGRRATKARIEATDTTIVLGFVDDTVIRIIGDSSAARVDIRSASRFGSHDLGRNAQRVEAFIKMFKARLQATVAIAAERAAARAKVKKKRKVRRARRRKESRRKRRKRRRR